MTNFQANALTRRTRWLTPERAVLVLPVAAGLLLSGFLMSLVLTPLLVRVQLQRQQVDALSRLRDEVPMLRDQLETSLARLEKRRQQEGWLLQLVAGTGEFDTFLAGLNDLAERSGVLITLAEPGAVEVFQPPEKPAESQAAPPAPAAGGAAPPPLDPLLREGLERRSAQVEVSGPFAGLLTFMRALEALEVFVEVKDLALKNSQVSSADQSKGQEKAPTLALSLKLRAYGRQPASASSP